MSAPTFGFRIISSKTANIFRKAVRSCTVRHILKTVPRSHFDVSHVVLAGLLIPLAEVNSERTAFLKIFNYLF